MASYPPPADPIFTRRPPSVNSRSAATRRHRSGRSHSGGATFKPQNEFPNFSQTGDVEIIISVDGQEKRYILHRLILAQCSGFFEAGTSEDWSRTQARSPGSGSGDTLNSGLAGISEIGGGPLNELRQPPLSGAPGREKVWWRYELDRGNDDDDEVPMLVQKVCLPLESTVESFLNFLASP